MLSIYKKSIEGDNMNDNALEESHIKNQNINNPNEIKIPQLDNLNQKDLLESHLIPFVLPTKVPEEKLTDNISPTIQPQFINPTANSIIPEKDKASIVLKNDLQITEGNQENRGYFSDQRIPCSNNVITKESPDEVKFSNNDDDPLEFLRNVANLVEVESKIIFDPHELQNQAHKEEKLQKTTKEGDNKAGNFILEDKAIHDVEEKLQINYENLMEKNEHNLQNISQRIISNPNDLIKSDKFNLNNYKLEESVYLNINTIKESKVINYDTGNINNVNYNNDQASFIPIPNYNKADNKSENDIQKDETKIVFYIRKNCQSKSIKYQFFLLHI